MRSDPLTAPFMESGAIHSETILCHFKISLREKNCADKSLGWYAPGAQMICGSSSGSYYHVTLIVYPKSTDKTANSLEILAANSSSSSRRGSLTALTRAVSNFEPRVRKLADLVKAEDCFLWKIAHLSPLPTWISKSGRVALLGDAAHAMVPHLGMGAASAVEDGGVLAECLSRAKSKADIPTALKAYEKIRKPRAERIQGAALVTGQYKIMPDGPEQRKRDQRMALRMDVKNPKYEYWKAGGGLEWLYGYDFATVVKKELDKVFGGSRARL